MSLNAHYDHYRSLPAAGNATGDESDLLTVADVPVPTTTADPALAGSILFTMGCHAGLNVPDVYVGATSTKASDWAQVYGGQRAVYVANTGFGYGDTESVALSERLMARFAGHLDGTVTVGEGLMFAKQAYFGDLGAYGVYDEKVLTESTFYGLPMYRIGTPPVTPPGPRPTTPGVTSPTPDATGLRAASVTLTPDLTKHTTVRVAPSGPSARTTRR